MTDIKQIISIDDMIMERMYDPETGLCHVRFEPDEVKIQSRHRQEEAKRQVDVFRKHR